MRWLPASMERAGQVTAYSIGGEKASIATLEEDPAALRALPRRLYLHPGGDGDYIDAAPKTLSVKAATGYDSSTYGGTVELTGTV